MPNQNVLDRIRTAAATGSAFLPVHGLFGVRALSAEPGHIEVGQRMGPWLLDRHDRLSPGAFLVGADAALGCGVSSLLDGNMSVVTLSIRVQFVRLDPAGVSDFVLRAVGTHIGGDTGFAVGEILDQDGRLFAHMSTRCCFLPLAKPVPVTPVYSADPTAAWHRREELGDPCLAPVAALASARIVGGAEHEVRIAARTVPELSNSRGDLQGGVLGLLAEQAISACLERATPAVARADSAEVEVIFLRAVRSAAPDIEATAQAVHASRRFAVAQARGVDGSGRLVVTASGSRYRG